MSAGHWRACCSPRFPVRAIIAGKLVAALSLWLGAFLVSLPLHLDPGSRRRDHGPGAGARWAGRHHGGGRARIDRVADQRRLQLQQDQPGRQPVPVIALFAPTQLPSGLPQGWFFEVLLRLNPVASGLTYVSSELVGGRPWTQDLSYLVSPLLSVVLAGGALALAGPRLLQLTAEGARD